jgi:hypothetical protein
LASFVAKPFLTRASTSIFLLMIYVPVPPAALPAIC